MTRNLLTAGLFLILSNFASAKTFTIKEGKHGAGFNVGVVLTKSLSFKAKFDQSAVYNLGNSNQYDINKLLGFSDCMKPHHTDSARFGWVWNDRTLKLEIHAYAYADGARNSALIDTIGLNKFYDYKILAHSKSYEFVLNGKSVKLPRSCSKSIRGYKLFPYFGGNETAPHNIKIEIQ